MRQLGDDAPEQTRTGGDDPRQEPAVETAPSYPIVEVSRIERSSTDLPSPDKPASSELPAARSVPLAPHEAFPPQVFRPAASAVPGAPVVEVHRIERQGTELVRVDEPASTPPPLIEDARTYGEPAAAVSEAATELESATEPAIAGAPELESISVSSSILAATPATAEASTMPAGSVPAQAESVMPPMASQAPATHVAPVTPSPVSEPSAAAGGRWEEFGEGRKAGRGRLAPMAFPPLTRGVVRGDDDGSKERPLRATVRMLFILAAIGALGWGGWWAWEHRAELTSRAGLLNSQPASASPSQVPAVTSSPEAARPVEAKPAEPKPAETKPIESASEPHNAQASSAAKPNESKSRRAEEDTNYHPEIVPPYPTLPEKPPPVPEAPPVKTVQSQVPAQPPLQAPSQAPSRPSLHMPRPMAPVVNQYRSGQEAAPTAIAPVPPTSYTASPDGTYMSPLAQNIVAVQALQRQSRAPLREFHGRVGVASAAAKGVTLTVQSANAAGGAYGLLATSGGSSYPLQGRVNAPLSFRDSATHTVYELVILRIAGNEVYGYVQPPQ